MNLDPELFLDAAEYLVEHDEYSCWALAICYNRRTGPGRPLANTYECPESDYFVSLFDDGTVPENDKSSTGLFGSHHYRSNTEVRIIALLLAYETLIDP